MVIWRLFVIEIRIIGVGRIFIERGLREKEMKRSSDIVYREFFWGIF